MGLALFHENTHKRQGFSTYKALFCRDVFFAFLLLLFVFCFLFSQTRFLPEGRLWQGGGQPLLPGNK